MTRLTTIASAPALALTLALAALLALPACDDSAAANECDDYVDYMCDCHPDEYDCEQLQNTYSDPDSETLDECALALEDQETEDADAEVTCGDTGTAR